MSYNCYKARIADFPSLSSFATAIEKFTVLLETFFSLRDSSLASTSVQSTTGMDLLNFEPSAFCFVFSSNKYLQIKHILLFGVRFACDNKQYQVSGTNPGKMDFEILVLYNSISTCSTAVIFSQPNSTSTQVGSDKVISWTTTPPTHPIQTFKALPDNLADFWYATLF